ncbi:MAG: dephospho-CoA kinase [Betaproteobacteria bacterium]|nr:dephospho-CoA kinase [Betaproteobacteria bacterium]
MKLVVGLTGGIGSGKSSVGNAFSAHGILVIDADAISRALTAAGGRAIDAIRKRFGDRSIDAKGALDRAQIRALVFSDPEARRQLEAILHPMIRNECDRLVAVADSPYVILMIPLLVESGVPRKRCHRVAVVDCPEEVQIERVIRRDRLTRGEVEAIMKSQASRELRLSYADDVIDNSGSPSDIAEPVALLHKKYAQLAGSQAWAMLG